MSKKRILLLYISKNSGHHRASLALEKAFRELSDNIETACINSFRYTNPVLEKVIGKTYMSVIRRRPEFWGRIYDNPKVVKKTEKLKAAIHKYTSRKAKTLLEDFRPDAIVCTQAFPCGIMADYKKTKSAKFLLAGILTDYAPHAYWLYDSVDIYFVPSEETKERLVINGIAKDRVEVSGIPIDPKFKKAIDGEKVLESFGLSAEKPALLIMGGSQGLGPIKEIIKELDRVKTDFQTLIVTGGNARLYRYLRRFAPRLSKKTVVLGYAENIDELMAAASLVISKPGGITISEALAKSLPMLIVKPIPGQEEMNTEYLLKNKIAVRVKNLQDVAGCVSRLLSSADALQNMRENAGLFSRPSSSTNIARSILERII